MEDSIEEIRIVLKNLKRKLCNNCETPATPNPLQKYTGVQLF